MATRNQRLIQQALRKTRLSPEDFAILHRQSVVHYSGRQIRRWAEGEAQMPEYVAEQLRAILPTLVRTP